MPPLIPRVVLLLSEMFRHGKAIGGCGDALTSLDGGKHPAGRRRHRTGRGREDVVAQLTALLAAHRAWERFPATGA